MLVRVEMNRLGDIETVPVSEKAIRANSPDVCDCHDAGVLPVDIETSSARFHARLTDGFIILGWTTGGDDNE